MKTDPYGFERNESKYFLGNMISGIFNYDAQRERMHLDEAYRRQLMSREDTAVQRRAKDLEAAGINRVMAAGQAAQAGPIVPIKAPQMDIGSPVVAALGLLQSKRNIEKTEAEKALIENQKRKINFDVSKTWQEIKELKHNIKIADKFGSSTKFSNKDSAINYLNILDKQKETILNKLKRTSIYDRWFGKEKKKKYKSKYKD